MSIQLLQSCYRALALMLAFKAENQPSMCQLQCHALHHTARTCYRYCLSCFLPVCNCWLWSSAALSTYRHMPYRRSLSGGLASWLKVDLQYWCNENKKKKSTPVSVSVNYKRIVLSLVGTVQYCTVHSQCWICSDMQLMLIFTVSLCLHHMCSWYPIDVVCK